jgi:hypothetical protein
MNLKTLATTAIATVAIGGLVTAPAASAKPMTCSQARMMAQGLRATGDVYFALGDREMASAYHGRADGMIEAAC